MNFLFSFLLSIISLFLILLVLVQRGRGGGLTGALGGMGGQSAFGTKAGDMFTRVTIISATVWILCAILAVKLLGGSSGPLGDENAAPPPALPAGADAGTTASPGGTGLGALDNLPPASPPDNGSTASPAGDSPPDASTTPAPGGDAEANPDGATE